MQRTILMRSLISSLAVLCLLQNSHDTDAFIFRPSSTPLHRHNNERITSVRCNAKTSVIGLGAATIYGLTSSIRVVREGEVSIVERLGRYHKILKPGLHVIIPLVDRIREHMSMREQVFDIPPQKCITRDNAPLLADAVIYWRIFDPKKAVYSVEDLPLAIQNLVLTQLRSEIGKITLDMTFSTREQINSILLKDLDIATDPWGVKINRVEVRDIVPNREIIQAMEKQMAAERTKRATVIQSEGQKERAINEAEGAAKSRLIEAKASAEALILQAEAKMKAVELEAMGGAQALELIAKAIDDGEGGVGKKSLESARFQLTREYVKAQYALASSPNSKVIFSPDSANSLLAQAMAFYEKE